MTTASATPPTHGLRVEVFLDYWNFTLSLPSEDRFHTDYRVLGGVLAQAALETVDPTARLIYEGMTVYGSFQEGERHANLRDWFDKISGFPAVSVVTTLQRRVRRTLSCHRCQSFVQNCPECGSRLRGFEEKGVDVRIATDMTGGALTDQYDIGVLVSSDRDFIPMAESMKARKKKIVHAAFPPKATELSRKCWSSFSLPRLMRNFRRTHGERAT